MPVPTSIDDISTDAALNYPKGNENPGGLLDNYLRTIQAIFKGEIDRLSGEVSDHGLDIGENRQDIDELQAQQSFPTGTRMLFAQASAPTGWTQITGDESDNRMLRVVSSAGGGKGGSHDPVLMNIVPAHTHTFSTGNPSANHSHSGSTGTVSSWHTHSGSTNTTGNHRHSVSAKGSSNSRTCFDVDRYSGGATAYTDYAGNHAHSFSTGNPSANHTHSFSTGGVSSWHTHSGTTATNAGAGNWTPRYLDLILCSKD